MRIEGVSFTNGYFLRYILIKDNLAQILDCESFILSMPSLILIKILSEIICFTLTI